MLPENKSYDDLISQIERLVEAGRNKALIAVNQVMVATYWAVGRYIVEFEQEGNEKAEYGSQLLKRLSSDLSIRLGNGYSHSNLNYMRMFFLAHPILETVSPKLSWGHWFEILKISDPPASARLIPPRIRPNSKPNARWRESFSFLPGISVGCADNLETDLLAFHPLHSSKPGDRSGSIFCPIQ